MVPGLYRESSVAVVQTLLLHSMWDIPRPKVQPVSPALAGKFFTNSASLEAIDMHYPAINAHEYILTPSMY